MLMLYYPFDNANALLSALNCLFHSMSEKILDFKYIYINEHLPMNYITQ